MFVAGLICQGKYGKESFMVVHSYCDSILIAGHESETAQQIFLLSIGE